MSGGWENVGRIHTVPVDDLYMHALNEVCACMPKVDHYPDSQVLHVTHNAFDGREHDEPLPKLAEVKNIAR